MQNDKVIRGNLSDLRHKLRASIRGQNKVSLGKFVLIQWLGGGNYGDVYKAVHTQNYKFFAIKIIEKQAIFSKNRGENIQNILKRLLQSQGLLMQICNSPNVLKCYEIIENQKYKILVLEYCNRASLFDQLKKRKAYPVNQALAILKQIIVGLSELHRNRIIHRDLKAENIMIHNGRYLIADFGFSKIIENQEMIGNFTVLGTRTTMAPQVKNRQKYGIKADIWSIGIIFYTMICSNIQFEAQSFTGRPRDIYKQIQKGHQLFFSTVDGKPDEQLKQFIKSMLNIDQKKRISWRQLINHRIFNKTNQQLFQNPVLNVQLGSADQTMIISQVLLKQHEAQLPGIISHLKVESQRNKAETGLSELGQELIQTINFEVKQIKQLSKLMKSDIDLAMYRQIQTNNLECHKAQYIYQQIILEIQQRQMLDIKRKSHNQLMYLLITRCFIYVSWAQNNIKINANDQMFQNYRKQLSELYRKIKQKWGVIEKRLFKISNSLFYKFCDLKKSAVQRYDERDDEKFFCGIQKLDYEKQQQVQYTQNCYIQEKINDLGGEPTENQNMKLKLRSYTKINQITLLDLQKERLTFHEKVRKILSV